MQTTTEPRKTGPKDGIKFNGKSLEQIRLQRGESVLMAAVGIGIYPSTLSRLEKGDRQASPKLAEKVCRYYSVSLQSLT